jgi:hypothetical protein
VSAAQSTAKAKLEEVIDGHRTAIHVAGTPDRRAH